MREYSRTIRGAARAAEHKGSSSGKVSHPALVFICHMDAVVEGSGWDKEAFSGEIKDGKLFGRGSCDMKGGLACALSVFAETAAKIRDKTLELEYPLVFIGTVDEEGDMRGVEQAVADGWVTAEDWVVDMEPTDGRIQMAQKGAPGSNWRCRE